MKKALLTLSILAAVGGGAWYWYGQGPDDSAIQYQTAEVARGSLTQLVTATGTLNPVVNVTIGCQISGTIKTLHADFNTPVKSGQVLAQIDPVIYKAVLHQVEGDLESAKAALELTQVTAKRKKDLVGMNAAPQADLDSAIAALHQAEAAVKVKEANLEKARADLDHCTVYSPIDGTVISRTVDVGQTVAASFNAPVLFTVANDLSKMQINAAVAEADVGMVEVAQSVEFTVDAFPYRSFQGKVTQVRNAATTVQNVVTYDVIIGVDNPELKLKPGMTANVSIVVAQVENALKLSNAALRFRPKDKEGASMASSGSSGAPNGPGGGKGHPRGPGKTGAASQEKTIYLLKNGEPVAQQVKVGINDGISTEILSGLNEKEVVITGSTGGPSTASAGPPSNPFGGGQRRRF